MRIHTTLSSQDIKSTMLSGNLTNDMHPPTFIRTTPSGSFGISSSNLHSIVSRYFKDLKLIIHEGSLQKLFLDKSNLFNEGVA